MEIASINLIDTVIKWSDGTQKRGDNLFFISWKISLERIFTQ